MLITRAFLKSLPFRVFTPNDYHGFAGVESPVPLMYEGDDYLVIIDGVMCAVYADTEDDGFDLVAECDDITKLEY